MDALSNHDLLLQNIAYIAEIVQGVSIILGVSLMLSFFFKLKKQAESRGAQQSQGMMGPLMLFFSASCLLVIPSIVSVTLNSVWGTDSPLSYNSGTNDLDQMMSPILAFVRLIGVIAMIRGILMLSKHNGEQTQPGQLSKALMHLLGGVLCIHVVGSSYLVLNFMGCFT